MRFQSRSGWWRLYAPLDRGLGRELYCMATTCRELLSVGLEKYYDEVSEQRRDSELNTEMYKVYTAFNRTRTRSVLIMNEASIQVTLLTSDERQRSHKDTTGSHLPLCIHCWSRRPGMLYRV